MSSCRNRSATVVQDIFKISRKPDLRDFAAVELKNTVDARKLLCHGSRSSNFLRDLEPELRIAPMEAPVNGYA
jgi:hypothetical protein